MNQANTNKTNSLNSKKLNNSLSISTDYEKENIKEKKDDNGQIKKEDFQSKNNNSKTGSETNKNFAPIPYSKLYSADNIDKEHKNGESLGDDNNNNHTFDEPNPLASPGKKKSEKKIPKLLDSLNKNAFTNIKNDELSVNLTVVSNNEKNIYSSTKEIRNNNLKKNLFKEIIEKSCFKNCGETSYLNTILQCLGHIKYLRNYFLDPNNSQYIKNNTKNLRLSFATLKIFYHIYKSKEKLYSLESFCKH